MYCTELCWCSFQSYVWWWFSWCHVQFFATPWTVARQAPLSMGFPRQEYWSRVPFPSPGDLPSWGIKPADLHVLHCRQVLSPLSDQAKLNHMYKAEFMSFRIDWLDLLAVQRTLQESSVAPQSKSISSLLLSLLYGPTLASAHDYWKHHSFDYTDFAKWYCCF